MAMNQSSSSSSSAALMTLNNLKYDVFVSFRGDTRNNFTDHLFSALQRKGILAFRDDTKLKKGGSIGPELLRAIEGSIVYVVVLSKNYASSTWCLGELESILHCVQVFQKRVLPIFYDVDPSEVRKQSGSYAEAFAKHEDKSKQMVTKWREALTEVGNLSGWDMRDKSQSNEIEKIVEEIRNVLGHKGSNLPSDLVQMDSPIEELEKLLILDSFDDIQILGICGMGGIGKTTLATILYDRISDQFNTHCFIEDLSKIYQENGPVGVQKQILHQILCDEHQNLIRNRHEGANSIQCRLAHMRAFIVLDNDDHIKQLEILGMNKKRLAPGSRIVITSRDAHVLMEYGVTKVYKVPLLNRTNSLQLFCRQAFKRDHIPSNYEELARDVLNYANGLPLAIKAVGSLLLGRDISEWSCALTSLRENSNQHIMNVLQPSFNGLEEMEKQIFLDIACFHNGVMEKQVKRILDCYGFPTKIGFRVLIDKSLISISDKGIIEMHSLVEELGKKIVQQNEPTKWSRLWLPEHYNKVMSDNMEKKVEVVFLACERRGKREILVAEALSKMSHLRSLVLDGFGFSGSLTCLSKELRYVQWNAYPFEHLPSSFQPNLLVELILTNSKIIVMWEDKKCMPNLRNLDLSDSECLTKLPNFRDIPNLERLNISSCYSLEELDPSIGVLKKLVYLNLNCCPRLRIPMNIFYLSSLKYLYGYQCLGLLGMKYDSSESASSSSSQYSKRAVLKRIMLPFYSSTTSKTSQQHPIPQEHTNLSMPKCLPFLPWPCLRELDITYCDIVEIPDYIGKLHSLEKLLLGWNEFITLPSFKELFRLSVLDIQNCSYLKALPELPPVFTIEKQKDDSFSDISPWRTPRLYIFNCPNLDVKEKLWRRVVFSWMIRFIQANQESRALICDIHIIVPRSEIPRWFNYQGEGSSISIDHASIIHDNNVIAIAFCWVFNEKYVFTKLKHFVNLNFYCGDRKVSRSIPGVTREGVYKSNHGVYESYHIWIHYVTRESFLDLMIELDNAVKVDVFQMEVLIMDKRNVEGGDKVKNCGFRWVSKQDLQHNHDAPRSL